MKPSTERRIEHAAESVAAVVFSAAQIPFLLVGLARGVGSVKRYLRLRAMSAEPRRRASEPERESRAAAPHGARLRPA